jgi:signal transduction histidine kinase/CheY-like chemotaxis protein
MDIPNAALAPIIAAVVECCFALFVLGLSRAPGWGRNRLFAALALTSAAYSACNLLRTLPFPTADDIDLLVKLNFPLGAMHNALWLWYTYGGEEGQWRRMPLWTRWLAVAVVVLPTAAAWSGLATVYGQQQTISVTSLELRYTLAKLTPLGNVMMLFSALRREPGAALQVTGFAFLTLCGLAEGMVAAGVFSGPMLADIGFIGIMIPVLMTTVRRIIEDARRLEGAAARLTDDVAVAIEARDRAQVALVEAERQAALGRLAAGVGHEINNPLTYLRLNLERVQRWAAQQSVPADVADGLTAIDDGAARITRIVRDLRDTIRPPIAESPLVSVDHLVASARRIAAHHLARVDQVEVTTLSDAWVRGDEARLVQVVVNLFGNAAQAIAERDVPGPSRIAVVVESTRDSIAIRVRDTGVGMSPAQLQRITEPFSTTRATRGGTGLGLFLSRQIIEQHHGRLEVESTLHVGTTVTIALPRATPTDEIPASVPRTADVLAPSTRLRVWLVDDDHRVLESLARALDRVADVVTMADGRRVLARLAAGETPDVLVCDLMMPEVDGIEVADAVAAVDRSLLARSVFLTGGATTPRAANFVSRSDVRVLYKPVTGRELVEAVLSVHEVGVPT